MIKIHFSASLQWPVMSRNLKLTFVQNNAFLFEDKKEAQNWSRFQNEILKIIQYRYSKVVNYLHPGQSPSAPFNCEVDPSVFEPPPDYTTLGPGRSEPMRDEDDNLLQFAIQQSLLDAGTESDQVRAQPESYQSKIYYICRMLFVVLSFLFSFMFDPKYASNKSFKS